MSTRKITIHSLIIATYIILSLVMGTLSFWIIQFRISEIMMLLCLKNKEYVLPLSIGCLISNIIGIVIGINPFPLDFIFGTIGTCISGWLMFKLKGIRFRDIPLVSLLMPALINGIVVGAEIGFYTNGLADFFRTFSIGFIYVFIGEIVSCSLLGVFLLKPLDRAYTALRFDDEKEV